jgi:hypothetical protein
MANKPDVKGAKADRSFHALDASQITWPDKSPDGPSSDGQTNWSSVKDRQKTGVNKAGGKLYTADEVADIVEAAIRRALQKEKANAKEKELVIGGK